MCVILPQHRLHVPLQPGEWMHGWEHRIRPWRRMRSDQHGVSRVWSGSLYGGCCGYTGTLTLGDTA